MVILFQYYKKYIKFILDFLEGFRGTSQSGIPLKGYHYVIWRGGARLGLRHPAVFPNCVHSRRRVRSGRFGTVGALCILFSNWNVNFSWPYRRGPCTGGNHFIGRSHVTGILANRRSRKGRRKIKCLRKREWNSYDYIVVNRTFYVRILLKPNFSIETFLLLNMKSSIIIRCNPNLQGIYSFNPYPFRTLAIIVIVLTL